MLCFSRLKKNEIKRSQKFNGEKSERKKMSALSFSVGVALVWLTHSARTLAYIDWVTVAADLQCVQRQFV